LINKRYESGLIFSGIIMKIIKTIKVFISTMPAKANNWKFKE